MESARGDRSTFLEHFSRSPIITGQEDSKGFIRMNRYPQVIQTLQAFSRFSGLHVVLKTAERAWLAPLPEELRYHCCTFCRAVKQHSGRMNLLCSRHHAETALGEAVRRRVPFETTCHAGVTELVIPIVTTRCRGAFFVGPLLSSGEGEKLPEDLRQLYLSMPKVSRVQAAALTEFFSSLLSISEPEGWQNSPRELLPPADYGRIDERMQEAMHILHRDFRRPLRAGEICREIGLSRSRFLHCFTKTFGIGFCEYLQRVRLSEAIQWIELTDLPLSAVAVECGFRDQSRFSALFKRYYRMTPGEFRKKRHI